MIFSGTHSCFGWRECVLKWQPLGTYLKITVRSGQIRKTSGKLL